MEYKYKAMKIGGEVIEGMMMGNSIEEVAQMLRSNQSYPISIDPYKKAGSKEISFDRKVNSKDLSFFCRQMNAMLNAGSTILRCLDIMRRQLENKKLREAVADMHGEVQKGKLLSQAMLDHPKIFPDLMIYMIESGELSGTLDSILHRLANHYEKEAKLKNKIKSAMVYPIILIILCIVVVIFLVTFILPTFVGMFTNSGVALPLPTRMLLAFSHYLNNNAMMITIAIGVIFLLFAQYFSTELGRKSYHRSLLRLPVLKGLNIKILTARFARNLSTLLSSGVPLLTALDNVSSVIGNMVVAEEIMRYREEIQKGSELHQVVRDGHLFPPMLDNMMEIGKESGALDTILEKTADYYDDEAEQALQRLVTMFEPAMIIFLAVIVGFIVISMAMPMFDMVQTIQ